MSSAIKNTILYKLCVLHRFLLAYAKDSLHFLFLIWDKVIIGLLIYSCALDIKINPHIHCSKNYSISVQGKLVHAVLIPGMFIGMVRTDPGDSSYQ